MADLYLKIGVFFDKPLLSNFSWNNTKDSVNSYYKGKTTKWSILKSWRQKQS